MSSTDIVGKGLTWSAENAGKNGDILGPPLYFGQVWILANYSG